MYISDVNESYLSSPLSLSPHLHRFSYLTSSAYRILKSVALLLFIVFIVLFLIVLYVALMDLLSSCGSHCPHSPAYVFYYKFHSYLQYTRTSSPI